MDLAESLEKMGRISEAQGDHGKALEFMLKALEIREVSLPEGHPDIATSLNYIADEYEKMGDHRRAQEYKRRALGKVIGSGKG